MGEPPRRVVVAGSTGSIGAQAVDIIADHPDTFQVTALAAGGARVEQLADQALRLAPGAVAVPDAETADRFQTVYTKLAGTLHTANGRSTGSECADVPRVLTGPDALEKVAAWPADIVLNAVAGAAGLPVTLAALRAGRTLALANKESLVAAGPLVTRLAQPGQIVPVDSEHAAIAHCLPGWSYRSTHALHHVRRLVLTCSGGPFHGYTAAQLATVNPDQALAHPTWQMGTLNTINSATLVNKGLEIIEAHLLFDIPLDAIQVVVHPQSVVHSMVEFHDGSTLAQASPPDMRLPIAAALAWPDRLPDIAPAVDWTTAHTWTFQPLDEDEHPTVRLARHVAAAGATYPAVYNAAAEQATALFLQGAIGFPAITDLLTTVVTTHRPAAHLTDGRPLTLDDIRIADAWARAQARQVATADHPAARPGRAQALSSLTSKDTP